MHSNEAVPGRETKVYEYCRQPRAWNQLLTPSQCAVFFKRVHSEIPLSPTGIPRARLRDSTFLVFDSIDEARRSCEAKVLQHPDMCCEIFDSAGKSQPPLLVIVHPTMAEKDELSKSSVRIRKVVAIVLFVPAIPLFWWDRQTNGMLVLPTFLGLTIIVAGLRILHWNMARRERIGQQEKRIQTHLKREQESLRGGTHGPAGS